jgi:hypothetical protein
MLQLGLTSEQITIVPILSHQGYHIHSHLLLLFRTTLPSRNLSNRRVQPTPPPNKLLYARRQNHENPNVLGVQRDRDLAALTPLNHLDNVLSQICRRRGGRKEPTRRLDVGKHLCAHLPRCDEDGLDFRGLGDLGELGAQRVVQGEERGFGGCVCGGWRRRGGRGRRRRSRLCRGLRVACAGGRCGG